MKIELSLINPEWRDKIDALVVVPRYCAVLVVLNDAIDPRRNRRELLSLSVLSFSTHVASFVNTVYLVPYIGWD